MNPFGSTDAPTIRSEAGRKLIAERRQRKLEAEQQAKSSSFFGFGGSSATTDPAANPPTTVAPTDEVATDPSSTTAGWGLSALTSKFTGAFGTPRDEEHDNFHEHEDDDHQPLDPEADDFSDVFLGRNPTQQQPADANYGWWQRAQRRYAIFGGTQRMCGCSTRTCLIITAIVVVVLFLILLIVAWSNKGAFMFI
jgi:hypothetical protein